MTLESLYFQPWLVWLRRLKSLSFHSKAKVLENGLPVPPGPHELAGLSLTILCSDPPASRSWLSSLLLPQAKVFSSTLALTLAFRSLLGNSRACCFRSLRAAFGTAFSGHPIRTLGHTFVACLFSCPLCPMSQHLSSVPSVPASELKLH